MTFCAKVAADVVGVSMIIAMHARVVVHVDAPYSARRLYILEKKKRGSGGEGMHDRHTTHLARGQ